MKYFFAILSAILIVSSCKTQDNAMKNTVAEKELITPCDCEIQSDEDIICASAVSESKNQMLSKRMARSDAQVELASLVETYILDVSNKFTDNKNINSVENFEVKRQEATRQVVKQTLTDMQITCQKVIPTEAGTYKTYIRIEMRKRQMNERINANAFFKTFTNL